MHDFSYLLDFRESDGNFQRDNFGLGGILGDPVEARVFSTLVSGTAHMEPAVDGEIPVMTTGIYTCYNRLACRRKN